MGGGESVKGFAAGKAGENWDLQGFALQTPISEYNSQGFSAQNPWLFATAPFYAQLLLISSMMSSTASSSPGRTRSQGFWASTQSVK